MKRDGTASDKHNAAHAAVPPPLPTVATPVDEPIAGKPQSTPSLEISTLMTEVLHKENLKRALERVKREFGTAAEVVLSNGVARTGTGQGNMRLTKFQGTAGYVTRMSGGVGGGGREAFSYPD